MSLRARGREMDRGGVMEDCSLAVDDDCFDDFADLPIDAQAKGRREARMIAARAIRTRSRIHARRASSEAVLAKILPPYIEDGDSWHIISGGDVDSLSYAANLIEHESFDRMLLSTWCMALDDVLRLGQWLDTGTLRWLDCYVGEIFPSQYADAYAALCATVRRHQGRVATFRNHSNVILLGNLETSRFLVIESSANINTNPRTEQTVVTADAALFNFYIDFFDGIKSNAANFPNWAPYGQAA